MKDLIVNIYKTLFFFDFAVVLVYLLQKFTSNASAISALCNEAVFLGVMICFTAFFTVVVERKKLKIFNFKNFANNFFTGFLAFVIPAGAAVLILSVFKLMKFGGVNKLSGVLPWLAAIFLNTLAVELLLRGYLFRLYRRFYGKAFTFTVITLLYISLNPTVITAGRKCFACLIIINLIYCMLAEYTNSFIAPFSAHFFFSAVNSLILGTQSLNPEIPLLLNSSLSGRKLFTGGESGFYGSLITLCMLFAAFVFLFLQLNKGLYRRIKRTNISK